MDACLGEEEGEEGSVEDVPEEMVVVVVEEERERKRRVAGQAAASRPASQYQQVQGE